MIAAQEPAEAFVLDDSIARMGLRRRGSDRLVVEALVRALGEVEAVDRLPPITRS